MKLVIDIEANSLNNPTNIWLVVCKDIDTREVYVFRLITSDSAERERFIQLALSADLLVGHNIIGYDLYWLNKLIGLDIPLQKVIDTLIISKLVDYSRQGHSIEDYGLEFGLEKIKFSDWTKWSQEMEDYCIRDVDICLQIYNKYKTIINSPDWQPSIRLEHDFQVIVNSLHDNGFAFNKPKAERLLDKVSSELAVLDKDILEAFPPKLKPLREIHPRVTKHGTLNKSDFRFVKDGDLSIYNGGPFTLCHMVDFNPSSHKQLIEILSNAHWAPIDKTQTHINLEREIHKLKYSREKDDPLDTRLKECYAHLVELRKTGWKINENNLNTLPKSAPAPARLLAKRILLESRRRTLTEWLGLVQDDSRIHGSFYGIGAWTHRMAHQRPNTANIPTDAKLLGREMRSLWQAPRKRLLVGVDAESIQLRIFAHYIDDAEFTDALVRGKKHEKTDPHSLNARIIGKVCKGRQEAKRFIYALLLGAGLDKLAEVLSCSRPEAEEALGRILERYTGFAHLKQTIIPSDAKRGWFAGLDGRKVRIPGDTPGQRKHLCMSGYLQNGEAVVMKKAAVRWRQQIIDEKLDAFIINFVHDEWQTETKNDMSVALRVAEIQAESLVWAGKELKLKCPLAGSYWNEDHKDYTIGTNWYQTH